MVITTIEIPKYKSEYVGAYVYLNEDVPYGRLGVGSTAYIHSRANAKDTRNTSSDVAHWGPVRILRLYSPCPCCGTQLGAIIPEEWIAEGKVEFINKDIQLRAFPISREQRPHDWSDDI
jgi:hypothetical protein